MFQIKICGITTVDDAKAAVDVGADAIGLNFYANSRRYIEPAAAREIASIVPSAVSTVGLFVNASIDAINRVRDEVPLGVVQLHGDEPPELLAELGSACILRALRFGPEGIKPVAEYLDRCGELGCMPAAVLIDAYVAGEYGGTGHQIQWQRLADERGLLPDIPLLVAGGLTAQNVAEAIHVVRPHGVDVSSGVEVRGGEDRSPRKDAAAVRDFVAAARRALSEAD